MGLVGHVVACGFDMTLEGLSRSWILDVRRRIHRTDQGRLIHAPVTNPAMNSMPTT
jgi:hypothetical protein